MSTPTPSTEPTPLKYRLNPCDVERYPVLAPIGDLLASVYETLIEGADCPCCLGTRVVLLVLGAALFGGLVAAFFLV